MKSKTDTSKGLNTSTSTKQTYKEINGKTRVGNAISTIWGGFKGIFTGKGAVQAKQDGTGVVLKDDKGKVLVDKQVNNTNWQNILAGVGLLVGGITGATSNEGTTPQELEIQNQQEIRTGSNTLLIVGVGIVVFIGSIWAYFKFRD
jgi:hypothetical protein